MHQNIPELSYTHSAKNNIQYSISMTKHYNTCWEKENTYSHFHSNFVMHQLLYSTHSSFKLAITKAMAFFSLSLKEYSIWKPETGHDLSYFIYFEEI